MVDRKKERFFARGCKRWDGPWYFKCLESPVMFPVYCSWRTSCGYCIWFLILFSCLLFLDELWLLYLVFNPVYLFTVLEWRVLYLVFNAVSCLLFLNDEYCIWFLILFSCLLFLKDEYCIWFLILFICLLFLKDEYCIWFLILLTPIYFVSDHQ